jgi:hypothetical protein
MEGDLRPAGELPQVRRRLRRPSMPWGVLVGLEVVTLAFLSAMLVLVVIPNGFDVEWDCFGSSGSLHTGADTYGDGFAVGGALGWLVATGVTAVVYTTGRQLVALAVPLVWFGALVLAALGVAASIGPLPC